MKCALFAATVERSKEGYESEVIMSSDDDDERTSQTNTTQTKSDDSADSDSDRPARSADRWVEPNLDSDRPVPSVGR